MDYTKGQWIAEAYPNGSIWVRLTEAYAIADVCTAKEDDAHLIATAVNGCQAVNPDNPMAVAESIKEMYEALQAIRKWLLNDGEIADDGLTNIMFIKANNLASKALAKAEGRQT